jgi:tripartite-type tricarboxylate transporter receptor subunit TctC
LKLTAITGVLASLKKSHWMLQPVIFIFVLLFVGVVQAQNFPSKPIKVIVADSPDSCSDLITHVVGQNFESFGVNLL